MRTPGSAICLASLLLGGAAFAEVTVKEEIEPGPVGGGDPIQVLVAVVGAEGPVEGRLPAGDFQLLGTSRSSSIQMRSGPAGMETSRNEQITFTVVAIKPGPLTIPAAQVTADGDSLSGQPGQVEVQVGHIARQSPRPDDEDDADPFASMQRQMRRFGLNDPFMRHLFSGDPFADQGISTDQVPVKAGDVRLLAIPDRKTASVGAQVTVSYYLVTRVPISGISDLQIPAIDGAATRTIELGKHLTPEEQGDEVRLLIARRALFPDALGRLAIKSAAARVTAGSVIGGQEVAVRSPPLTVGIIPLPAGPSPAVVGTWALSLNGPAEVTAGQPATHHVIAKGSGDLDSLPTPELRTPAAWKVFPPTTKEQPMVANGLVGGTRTCDFGLLSRICG